MSTSCFDTIPDAWYWLKKECLTGYRQDIQRGSFDDAGDVYRRQSMPVTFCIQRPLNIIYIPKEYTEAGLRLYFTDAILNPIKPKDADYTYGERIAPYIEDVMRMLRDTPRTNQAVLSISRPEDIRLKDPPCLRAIQFILPHKHLHLVSYWRSNDIDNAFIWNQYAMAFLLEMMAEYAELKIGRLYYFSPGAHVYRRKWEYPSQYYEQEYLGECHD